MQPHNADRKFGAPFRKAPMKAVYDHLGGQVMTFVWAALLMGFVVALTKSDALIGFAGLVTGLGTVLTARAIGEDKYVVAEKIRTGAT